MATGPLLSLGRTAGGWSPSMALVHGGPSPCVFTLPGEHQSHQDAAPYCHPMGAASHWRENKPGHEPHLVSGKP